MTAYPCSSRREMIALVSVAAVVLLITIPLASGAMDASTAARVAAGVFAVLVVAGVALAILVFRRRRVVLDPGRVGRLSGWPGSDVVWCDLNDVVHVTTVEYRVLFAGPERHLLLWSTSGGASGLAGLIARQGMNRRQKEEIEAARSTNRGLRPFVVPLTGLSPEHVLSVTSHVSAHEAAPTEHSQNAPQSSVDMARHEEVNGRLRGVLIRVSDQLDPTTVELVDDLIDAGEGPIALDMVSEMLAERDARLEPVVIGDIKELADDLDVGSETVERLLPLVRHREPDGLP